MPTEAEPIEWNAHDAAALLDQAHRHAADYIATIRERPVFPSTDTIERLAAFDEPLPDAPGSPTASLSMLHEVGSPATVAQTRGRYFGFVDGGMLPIALAARWLADTWDQNTAQYVMSPVASRLEQVCERWIVELLGLPDGTAAGFVCGTTIANLSALCAARNDLLARQGWDVRAKGLRGAPALRIIAGADAHASVIKVVSILGMGTDTVESVPVDDQGRMIPDRLPELREPALVLTQAGNVNSGAFDPVGEICRRVRPSGSWVHVDGAFGLWAGASPAMRPHYEGIEQADSWSADAHKTLNVPYDSGIVLCRDRTALTNAFQATGSYFVWTEHREGMSYTPSMSRRARAVEIWAVLKTLGRNGVAQLIDQLGARARRFAQRLADAGFTIRNEIVFNQVLLSCESDDLTDATLIHLQSSGQCWCGGSSWKGARVIRISVCDWATTTDDVDESVAALVLARERARRGSL